MIELTIVSDFVTVTVHVALIELSRVEATVIVAVPSLRAFISPEEETVATLELLDVHVKILSR